jgi:hypothetical protein
VRVDWQRLKAVVIESDDWGLCAWVPDREAHRALAAAPAFRTVAGRRYGGSTLESAADVRALVSVLREFRGADGLPPAWQANTIVAAIDWDALAAPFRRLPLRGLDALAGRWARPGLLEAWGEAASDGTWWPELHGLHHLPEAAYLSALRRGDAEAHAAAAHEVFVCAAVESGGEQDPAEPRDFRARALRESVARFAFQFGRRPSSFCPPDYRSEEWTEREAATHGLAVIQGVAERGRGLAARIVRRLRPARFPESPQGPFRMPPRIAFEPRGDAAGAGRVGVEAAHRAARAAWSAGRPAVLSTHRLNYAHLDDAWSAAGRTALRALLARLCADGATFLVDAEVASLATHGWSVRTRGAREVVLRQHGAADVPVRFAAPAGATGARDAGGGAAPVTVTDGQAEARVGPGDHRFEWTGA